MKICPGKPNNTDSARVLVRDLSPGTVFCIRNSSRQLRVRTHTGWFNVPENKHYTNQDLPDILSLPARVYPDDCLVPGDPAP